MINSNFYHFYEGIRLEQLDRFDRAILSLLQADGRMPVAKLAEKVGLSETPCARRLKRLENEGYIEGYRAVLSRKALQIGVTVFAHVRFSPHLREVSERFEREIQGIERIVSCHIISGSADFMLQIAAHDIDEYSLFMRDVLRQLPGVASVESILSLGEVKPFTGLPLL